MKAGRKPVVAAVGYIGVNAPTVMPLRRGDILVCDASDPAIRGRLTSAAALATFHRKGVAVFSVDGLHAKVIASTAFAWIGSANASKNSEDGLIEASARLTGPQARQLHAWANGLATEDAALGSSDIRRLKEIKLEPARGGPRTRRPPAVLPPGLGRVRFFETEAISSKADQRATDSDRRKARSAARASGLPSTLQPIIWAGGTAAKPGDWVIDIRNGHVSSPAYVVRVAHHPRGDIIWLSPVKTSTRPKVAALRALAPALAPGFGTRLIRDQRTVDAVLSLFA